MRKSITLLDLLVDTPVPTGVNQVIVAFEYTTPYGWSYLTRLKIERQTDQKLIAFCPACGEKTLAFCHHPADRGLRCVECIERIERTERKQNIKVVEKTAKRTAKRQRRKAA